MGKAVRSYIFSRFCWIRRKSKWVLNTQPNPNGFDIRVENGAKAGKLLLRYFEENPATKIHVVCHSMGYAYFLGIIDILAPTQTFGKALILSPEAASTASRDWTIFEEIWQYGAYTAIGSLDLMCTCLDIPTPKDGPINGGMVHEAYWKKNDIEGIVKYCEKDVTQLIEVIKKLKISSLIAYLF